MPAAAAQPASPGGRPPSPGGRSLTDQPLPERPASLRGNQLALVKLDIFFSRHDCFPSSRSVRDQLLPERPASLRVAHFSDHCAVHAPSMNLSYRPVLESPADHSVMNQLLSEPACCSARLQIQHN